MSFPPIQFIIFMNALIALYSAWIVYTQGDSISAFLGTLSNHLFKFLALYAYFQARCHFMRFSLYEIVMPLSLVPVLAWVHPQVYDTPNVYLRVVRYFSMGGLMTLNVIRQAISFIEFRLEQMEECIGTIIAFLKLHLDCYAAPVVTYVKEMKNHVEIVAADAYTIYEPFDGILVQSKCIDIEDCDKLFLQSHDDAITDGEIVSFIGSSIADFLFGKNDFDDFSDHLALARSMWVDNSHPLCQLMVIKEEDGQYCLIADSETMDIIHEYNGVHIYPFSDRFKRVLLFQRYDRYLASGGKTDTARKCIQLSYEHEVDETDFEDEPNDGIETQSFTIFKMRWSIKNLFLYLMNGFLVARIFKFFNPGAVGYGGFASWISERVLRYFLMMIMWDMLNVLFAPHYHNLLNWIKQTWANLKAWAFLGWYFTTDPIRRRHRPEDHIEATRDYRNVLPREVAENVLIPEHDDDGVETQSLLLWSKRSHIYATIACVFLALTSSLLAYNLVGYAHDVFLLLSVAIWIYTFAGIIDYVTEKFQDYVFWQTIKVCKEYVMTPVNYLFAKEDARGDVERQVTSWKALLLHNDDSRISKSKKLVFMDLKTLVHIIYHLVKGEKHAAMEWATNYLVTRTDQVITFISMFNFENFKLTLSRPRFCTYTILGKRVTTSVETHQEAIRSYESGAQYIPQDEEFIETQSGEMDMMGAIFNLFSTITAIKMDSQAIAEANRQFQFIRYTNENLNRQTESLKVVTSTLSRTLFAMDPFDQDYQNFVGRVLQCLKEMDNVVVNFSEEKLHQKETFPLIARLYDEMLFIKNHPRYVSLQTHMTRRAERRFEKFEDVIKDVKSRILGNKKRVVPTSILFTGPPGVGKSTFIEFLMQSIVHLEHKEDPSKPSVYGSDMTYYYNAKDEYFSNYFGEMFFVMDDMLASSDAVMRNGEMLNVIHMVNPIPMNLAQPELDRKGRVWFISKYCLFSTNAFNSGFRTPAGNPVKPLFSAGLTDDSAVARRFHICLHRDTKLDGPIHLAQFRVDKCDFQPNLEGTMISAVDAVLLIRDHQRWQEKRNEDFEYDQERLAQLFTNGVEMHSNENYSFMHMLSDICALDLSEWYRSARREVMIGLCVILFSIAIIIPLYSHVKRGVSIIDDVEVHSWKDAPQRTRHRRGDDKVVRHDYVPKTIRHGQGYRESSDIQTGKQTGFITHSNEINYNKSLALTISRGAVLLCATVYDRKPVDPNATKERSEICEGFHYKDGYIITCGHFMEKFLGDEKVLFRMKHNGKVYEFPAPAEIHALQDLDLVMFRLEYNFDLPPAMRDYMIKDDELYVIPEGHPMKLVSLNQDGSSIIKNVTKNNYEDKVSYTRAGHTYIIAQPISYWEKTEKGQSGAMLLVEGKQGRPVIVGMHIGLRYGQNFGSGMGLAIPLTREMIDSMVSFETQSLSREFPLEITEIVPAKMAYFAPNKSKIRQTHLFEIFGKPTRIPAHLRPGMRGDELVDPYLLAIKKMHQVEVPCKIGSKKRMKDYLHYCYPDNSSARLIDFPEVVNAIPKSDIKSIALGTSAGYPWCLAAKKGKFKFIKNVDGKFVIEEDFLAILRREEELLRQGVQIRAIYCDILKDELRPVPKVVEYKTRLIGAGPVNLTCLTRKYFIAFTSYMQSRCVKGPCAVGINPHSIEWAALHNRLNKFDKRVIAGDFTNFDGKLPSEVVKLVIEFINEWYDDGPINARVRELLGEHIWNPERIHNDIIYRVLGGMASGSAITAPGNSLANIMMLTDILMTDFGLHEDEFEITTYGDDNVATTDDERVTLQELTRLFKERYDMDYTHYSKGEYKDDDKLSTIRFLSRKFVPDHCLMRAPLELEKILEMVYWYRTGETEEVALLATISNFFTELFHHGEEVYKHYSKELLKHVSERCPELYDAVASLNLRYDAIWERNYTRCVSTHCGLDDDGYPLGLYDDVDDSSGFDGIETHSLNQEFGVQDTMNRENAHRQTLVPEQSIPTRLGVNEEVAQVTESALNPATYQKAFTNFNAETFDLSRFIGIEVPINPVSWATTNAAGTVLLTAYFPDVLLSNGFLTDKLKNFAMMRAGIRVSMRVVASNFDYGKLCVTFYPSYTYLSAGEIALQQGMPECTHLPHMLLSASQADVVTYDWPFISFNRMLNLTGYNQGELGVMNVIVMNPLLNAQGNTTSAKVYFTFQFLEPEVALPYAVTSAQGEIEMDDEDIDGVVTQSHATIKGKNSYPNYMNNYTRVVSAEGDMRKRREHAKKRSQPSSEVMRINPYFNNNTGGGVNDAQPMGLQSADSVTKDVVAGGVQQDETDINYFVGTPVCVSTQTITSATGTITVNDLTLQRSFVDYMKQMFRFWSGSHKFKLYFEASPYHNVQVVIWLNLANNKTAWYNCYHKMVNIQGPTEVAFMVPYLNVGFMTTGSGTNLYVMLTVLSWSQANDAVSTPIYMNVYKAGATDFKFCAPVNVVFQRTTLLTDTPDENGKPDDNAPDSAPDGDFIELHSNPRADFSDPFEPLHPSMKEYEHSGLFDGSEYTSILDLGKRMWPYYVVDKTNTQMNIYNTQAPALTVVGNCHLGIEMLGMFYAFQRGSIRYQLMQQGASFAPFASVVYDVNYTNYLFGGTISSNVNPVQDMEVPYYSRSPFLPTTSGYTHPHKISISGTGLTFFLNKALGHDFTFMFLKGPPAGNFVAPSTDAGFEALRIFFDGA